MCYNIFVYNFVYVFIIIPFMLTIDEIEKYKAQKFYMYLANTLVNILEDMLVLSEGPQYVIYYND